MAISPTVLLPTAARAADHGDGPTVAHDQSADIGDLYFFLDPNPSETTQAVMIMTFRGFIVPGEAVNFAIYDPSVRYRFEIENTGDATPDTFIDVQFTQRTAADGPAGKEILQVPAAQKAVVTFPRLGNFAGGKFVANVLNPNFSGAANTPTMAPLTDRAGNAPKDRSGAPVPIKFFAGEVDDPFFFDIPAFGRFIGSVRAGSPDPSFFSRGRDSFGGYNILAIAISVPASLLKGRAGDVVGLSCATQRRLIETPTVRGEVFSEGAFRNVDREGVPAVNVALVPFRRKNEYNASSPTQDARLRFGGDIIKTLAALGTSGANPASLSGNAKILADVAVLNGDILRLNTNATATGKRNTGNGGGDNAGSGFPNGRRLHDDVIDTLLNLITNGVVTTGDNVNSSISQFPLQNAFPFLAPAQQPVASTVPATPTTTDDRTQN